MNHSVRIKFWNGGVVGGWNCALEIEGQRYPVNRVIGDGHGAGMSVSFDNKQQARTAAIAEARRIIRRRAANQRGQQS